MKRLAVVILALISAGCATSPDRWLLGQYSRQNTISAFRICKNYGCTAPQTVSFSANDWAEVHAVFEPAARSASEEREQIRHAIARIEPIVGPRPGTANDRPGADIIAFDREGQLDCIDEAYNTPTY